MIEKKLSTKFELVGVAVLFLLIATALWITLMYLQNSVKQDILGGLQRSLRISQSNIYNLHQSKERAVQVLAGNDVLQQAASELINIPVEKNTLSSSPIQSRLRLWIAPILDTYGYQGFFVIDEKGFNLASMRDSNLADLSLLSANGDFLDRVWAGETRISLPQHSDVPLMDKHGQLVNRLPTMFVASPIWSAGGSVIAILAIRLDPDRFYSETFERGYLGKTQETYAFNKQGALMSESRFNYQLAEAGLIPDDKHSTLLISIRDPGVNLITGGKPLLPVNERPLTFMARDATQGNNGYSMDAYRDYRGIEVIGAWVWDENSGIGIATEIDAEEAFEFLNHMRFSIAAFGVIAFTVLVILVIFSRYSRNVIEKSNELNRSILSSVGEGIFGLDRSGLITFANPATSRMTGYDESELVGSSLDFMVSDDRFSGSFGAAVTSFSDGEVHQQEGEVFWRKDGSSFAVEYTVTPNVFQGKRTGTVVAFKDISERLEAEQARDRLLSAVANSGEGIILFDSEDKFIYANQKYRELYPSEASNLVPGSTFRDIVKSCAYDGLIEEAIGREEEWIEERVAGHQSLQYIEEEKTSSGRWVQVSEYRTDDGGIFGVRNDITNLKESQLSAESANQAKSEFLSSMSHELRTPLNAILGFSQILSNSKKEPLTEYQSKAVNNIVKSGDHLLLLINDVLDLAKIESGRMELAIELVYPKDVFAECLDMVRVKAAERGISLSGHRESEFGVRADYNRLKQAILNLLSNAIKYNIDQGSVKFGCIDQDLLTVRIYVTDTGIGIPADKLDELFEPFKRLGMEPSTIQGTGIGLSITKKLIEQMGGLVGCQSEPGKGSTFWIDLPRADNKGSDN
ncbi:MAG: PAS domain S-box protein [Gammaproteobacteria bacterium]|nr:PAS domain S-box protein [Gammaproteobacteria bacterium]